MHAIASVCGEAGGTIMRFYGSTASGSWAMSGLARRSPSIYGTREALFWFSRLGEDLPRAGVLAVGERVCDGGGRAAQRSSSDASGRASGGMECCAPSCSDAAAGGKGRLHRVHGRRSPAASTGPEATARF